MRIVLNTFGSLGDLNPYLALAAALKRRGHQAVVATSEVYRQKVEDEGVEFAPVRPDVGELLNQPELTAKLWHPRQGSEFLIRDYILPQIEASYEDCLNASSGADLVLTHIAGYAAPIAAEAMGIRWLSLVLQPMVMFSAYDPPVIPNAAWLRHLYRFGPDMFRALMRGAEFQLNRWAEPIVRLRTKAGLKTAANPLLGGQFSPFGTILLFSRYFAAPQADWPSGWRQTGFIFYDRQGQFGTVMDSAPRLSDDLERFLAAGEPPVLFTLGSSAVTHPGTFFRESMKAAVKAGRRAVLLTGPLAQGELAPSIPETIFVASYLPYSQIMPRVSAIVHQGGVGTTAQAMRAGRPMLVVPWSHDQPDNAARLTKLGVARTVRRNGYKASRVAIELTKMLSEDRYRVRARELGEKISAEDGLTAAVNAIEEMAASKP